MKITIADYPSSYLIAELEKDETIITEKGALIYSDGEYTYENKVEAGSFKNWLARLFGKSLTYNIYRANEDLKLVLSPDNNAEIFSIDIREGYSVFLEPDMHFARTSGVEISFTGKDWKSTLNDGPKLKCSGIGSLILKGYGKIIKQEIDTEKGVFVDEDALIAFDSDIEVKTISKGAKELFTSGEVFFYKLKGKGTIWVQTREKTSNSSGGTLVNGLTNFIK